MSSCSPACFSQEGVLDHLTHIFAKQQRYVRQKQRRAQDMSVCIFYKRMQQFAEHLYYTWLFQNNVMKSPAPPSPLLFPLNGTTKVGQNPLFKQQMVHFKSLLSSAPRRHHRSRLNLDPR